MSEWKEVQLGDVLRLKRGYDLPATQRKNGVIPIYSSSGITDFHFEAREKGPGVITGRYGTIGEVFYSEADYWPLNTTLFIEDFKGNYPLFIYYFLKNLDFEKFNDKSAVPGINRNDVHAEYVKFPSLPIQKLIATNLSSLDNKIDLLTRQNKTLEQLAETYFRQWFVEEAEDSWTELTVGEVVDTKGGTTPSTNRTEFWDGSIAWTSPRDLSNSKFLFLNDTQRKITHKGLAQIGSGLLPVGTLLLSSRAPIGYLAITQIPVAINQGYIAIICNKSISNYFMYLWVKQNMDSIMNASNGSTFDEISKSSFRSLSFTIPPGAKLTKFETLISPLFKKIKENELQIRSLQSLRDALLPKLMSGEIEIKA